MRGDRPRVRAGPPLLLKEDGQRSRSKVIQLVDYLDTSHSCLFNETCDSDCGDTINFGQLDSLEVIYLRLGLTDNP